MALMLKCKMCGGDLELAKGSSLGTCQYCGTTQTVPAIDDDKKARLYNRANQYRMDSEFDKAYAAYEAIVNDEPEEAEAYWGMLLSEYGVEYVDDPKTGKKIPTCHRTLVRSITSNPNYKSACQYADADSRIMYEDDAAALDALQKRVLNASAKEEPYDVFICYKESDENGNRTPDSVMAQDIYDALTAKGMRVFFSRISLEDRLGQDYEPCIFAALNSAKVMLMVTANSDHCNAVWVKNEWKRYLDFMKTDPDKTLIPVYKDISPYALPDEFSRFQAQDMGKLGAIQDLVRGVEKLTGKAKKTAGGMTTEEKSAFEEMVKGQKKLRCVLLMGLLGAIGFFAPALLNVEAIVDAIGRIPAFTDNGRVFYTDNLHSTFVTSVILALPFAAWGINCTYGLRSKGANLMHVSLCVIAGIVLTILPFCGIVAGAPLWVFFGLLCVFALITTFLARSKQKAVMLIMLLLIAASAASALLVG